MKYFYLFLACMLSLACACTFSPSGEHFEELSPTPQNNIRISLSDKRDTVFARDWARLHFQLEYPGKNFYGYQLLLDGKVIHTVEHTTFYYDLSTTQLSDGAHELQLVLATSSGTNSLADKIGLETMQVFRKWVLMVDNAPPSPVKITSIAAVDGTLRIQWEKYKRRDIKHYRVYRFDADGYYRTSYTLPPGVTSVDDTTYLGGEVNFVVSVIDSRGLFAESEKAGFSTPAPGLASYEYLNEHDLRLTFRGTRFYRNFGSYTVTCSWPELSHITTDIADTVVTFTGLPYSSGFQFQLYVSTKGPYKNPKDINNNFKSPWESVPGNGVRHDLPYGLRIHAYNPQLDRLYDLINETISVVDAATMELKHQKKLWTSYTTVSSYSAKHIYVREQLGGLLELNPQTLETSRSINLSKLLPGSGQTTFGLRVSDTNKMAVLSLFNNVSDTLYVLDMNTGKLELRHAFEHQDNNGFSISPDGNMLLVGRKAFHRAANGTWQDKTLHTNPYSSPIFHPTEPYYILNEFSTYTVYSTKDNTYVSTFNLGEGFRLRNIDPATGYLFVVGDNTSFIYDFIRNQKVKEIKSGFVSPIPFLKDKIITSTQYYPIKF